MEVLGTRGNAFIVIERGPEGEFLKMAHVSGDKANELCGDAGDNVGLNDLVDPHFVDPFLVLICNNFKNFPMLC